MVVLIVPINGTTNNNMVISRDANNSTIDSICQTKLWILEVRYLAAQLLSLGVEYDVAILKSSNPNQVVDIHSVFGSNLFQIQKTHPMDAKIVMPSRMRQNLINAVAVEDFIVEINSKSLVHCPASLNKARMLLKENVTLKLVRLQADLYDYILNEGNVAVALEMLEKMKLKSINLVEQGRELHMGSKKDKKLLKYLRMKVDEIYSNILRQKKAKFVKRFLDWSRTVSIEHQTFEAGSSRVLVGLNTSRTQQPSQYELEGDWLISNSADDLKWLPNAADRTGKLAQKLDEALRSDGIDEVRVRTVTTRILKELLRMYTLKYVKSGGQEAVEKEFFRHARSLVFNLKIPANASLRLSLLSGNLDESKLCNMSSDDLAPRDLQKQRQERFEQHAQKSIIHEPRGIAFIKTKHGLKEVVLGDTANEVTEELVVRDQSSAQQASSVFEATSSQLHLECSNGLNNEENKSPINHLPKIERFQSSFIPEEHLSTGESTSDRSLENATDNMISHFQRMIEIAPTETINRHPEAEASLSDYECLNEDLKLQDRTVINHNHAVSVGALNEDSSIHSSALVHRINDNKRPFHSLEMNANESHVLQRRKLAEGISSSNQFNDQSSPSCDSSQLFFSDSKGSDDVQNVKQNSCSKEVERVESYQELIKTLFKNDFEKHLQGLKWEPTSENVVIPVSPRLMVYHSVKRIEDEDAYQVEFKTSADVLRLEVKEFSLESAVMKISDKIKTEVEGMTKLWMNIVLDFKKRRGNAPNILMASNETRDHFNKHILSSCKKVGHLIECRIDVLKRVIVRSACINKKMAKRAASEQFAALLDALLKNLRSQPSLESAQGVEVALRNDTIKSGPAQVAICSDDDESANSSDSELSDVGYSSGEDNMPTTQSMNLDRIAANAKNEIIDEKNLQYDVLSETRASDHCKFRALIRKLLFDTSDLNRGLKELVGYSKYKGVHECKITPNIVAEIKIERQIEGVFQACVSVNDVVQATASSSPKGNAINHAVFTMLHLLEDTKMKWSHLLNFFHTKMLSTSNVLDAFNALRLANISKIDIKMADAGNQNDKISCALLIDNNVVYRVSAESEHEVRYLAYAQCAKFLVNLVDAKMVMDAQLQSKKSADIPIDNTRTLFHWNGIVRINDPVDLSVTKEFSVGGTWTPAELVEANLKCAFDESTIIITQSQLRPIKEVEHLVENVRQRCSLFYVESPYDGTKFLNAMQVFGSKNSVESQAVEMIIVPHVPFRMFLIPPGSSVNSMQDNLYWPDFLAQYFSNHRKKVFGVLIPKTNQ